MSRGGRTFKGMLSGRQRPVGSRCPVCRHSLSSEGHTAWCVASTKEAVAEVHPPKARRQSTADAMEEGVFPLVSAAHEFKTPLVVILGYADLLRHGHAGPVNRNQEQMLIEIQQSADRLQRVIQDVLLLSELRATKKPPSGHSQESEISPDATDLNKTLRELFEYWAPMVGRKSIEYEFCPAEGGVCVQAEPLKLQRIVSNLIENAFYYTPTGGRITVTVTQCFWDRRNAQSGSLFKHERRINRKVRNAICIEVSDTGPGIPPDHHEDIFADFVQLPGASARGTGLGLAIARRLVEAHQGRIWVESVVGKGSKFRVLLPQVIQAENPNDVRAKHPARR